MQEGIPRSMLQHRGQARAVRVRGDGVVCTVGEDSEVRVYPPNKTDPQQLLRAKAPLWSVDVCHDLLVVGADDGFAYLFRSVETS